MALTGPLALLLALPADVQRVPREAILTAMQESHGYELTATANAARLQAEVLLRLVRRARDRDPEGAPLFIDRADWFAALLERTGLSPDAAPLYARLAHEHAQHTLVDYREARVLAEAEPRPRLAANVVVYWERAPGRRDSYSYDDDRASPRLRVSCRRLIRFRLLDFGDRIVYADVEGLRGRPTSGALGALFALVGEASILESRISIAADGLQVTRGRARKAFFDVTVTATIDPSGRAVKGLPPDRPDLRALEARLKQPLKLVFVPFDTDEAGGDEATVRQR
jgi:hypothetical protein